MSEALKILQEFRENKRYSYMYDRIDTAIEEVLAKPEQEGVYQKLLRIEAGIEVEVLPSELWQDGYEIGRKDSQKRGPLSDEEIFEIGYKAGFAIDGIERGLSLDYGFLDEDGDVDNEPYFKLVRAIEKAHSITGIGQ